MGQLIQTTPGQSQQQREDWKADAFVNVFIDLPDGQGGVRSVKLSNNGLPLYNRRNKDAEFIQAGAADADGLNEFLREHVRFDFQMADGSSSESLGLADLMGLNAGATGTEG